MNPRLRVRALAAALAGALAAACGERDSTDLRTEHPAAGAMDTAIARSNLPGAAGARRALEAADSARARRAQEDSVGW